MAHMQLEGKKLMVNLRKKKNVILHNGLVIHFGKKFQVETANI